MNKNHSLLSLNDEKFWDIINTRYSNRGGVYKIIAFQNGQRVAVNRFLGTDKEGVLYIGKATAFIDRVIALKRSISPHYNGSSHICGRRYKYIPNIAKTFPFEVLYLELIESDTPDNLEKELLVKYRNIYGEVPPLNAI